MLSEGVTLAAGRGDRRGKGFWEVRLLGFLDKIQDLRATWETVQNRPAKMGSFGLRLILS